MIREPKNQSKADKEQFKFMEKVFNSSSGTFSEKIDAFPKFASRQAMAKFLARYEIFKKMMHVNGSIIECGVLHGGGLFTWAKLSSILEPTNHVRKIIGFDTFEGFPSIDSKDKKTGDSSHFKKGALTGSTLKEISQATKLFDLNRPIPHIPKIELIKGDMVKTAPKYLEKNPHLVVSLLYLDVDLYEPTKAALETFIPRMPKGSIIVFDQLNAKMFPGETIAVDEVAGIANLKIERFPFDSYISYSIL
ncbi:TylF/MycF/NovP-related O-methyltransferase [Nitrosopumilus sp.]|uniref:TylF/MycF/NovP-related O-methyltransferase n=1 Tax=Nitrosopumilus sp. TaxID=2024843 RepID=UPI0026120966|nr:TylF/MycF/NovP-related O-methyltransferase [Nitrosopumilus sp.]